MIWAESAPRRGCRVRHNHIPRARRQAHTPLSPPSGGLRRGGIHTAPRRGWIRRPVLDRRVELSRRAESTWSGRIGCSQKEPMDGPAGIRNPGVIPPGYRPPSGRSTCRFNLALRRLSPLRVGSIFGICRLPPRRVGSTCTFLLSRLGSTCASRRRVPPPARRFIHAT